MSIPPINMIRCFKMKNKEERAEIGHLDRGSQIEDDVAENKGQ